MTRELGIPVRWKVSWFVESIGAAIIQIGVKIRNSSCKCSLCRRDLEAMLNESEERDMQHLYLLERFDQLEQEHGLCRGEAR